MEKHCSGFDGKTSRPSSAFPLLQTVLAIRILRLGRQTYKYKDTTMFIEHNLESQPDPFVWLSMLPNQREPMVFLKQVAETLQVSYLVQQTQSEALQQVKAEAEAKAQAKAEVAVCNRLIHIVLEHVKSKGVSPNNLPNLKRKSYSQLCDYIMTDWPELSLSV